VFKKRVLRRIFGPTGDEVTREWRKLHNVELNDLYCSPCIDRVIKSRRMSWARHLARMGEIRDVYRVSLGKPEGKRPLGRPRCRWEENIKMDLQEVGCEIVDWDDLAQDRDRRQAFVIAVMNFQAS
jgi:cell wall assembly regulator SMI1